MPRGSKRAVARGRRGPMGPPGTLENTSGVNADLLEGNNAASFLKYADNAHARSEPEEVSDLDSVTLAGFNFIYGTGTNLPVSGQNFLVSTFRRNNANNLAQVAISNATDSMYIRRKLSSTWQPWVEIFTSGSDGDGSGSDADMLDGNHASAFQTASDERIKDNIVDLEDITDKLMQIRLRRFNVTDTEWSHIPGIGVIAQELESVFPEFVRHRNDGDENSLKLVDYGPLAVLAIQAFQSLNKRVEALEKMIHDD